MAQQSLYQQVLDYANRANPYPLYAQLRQTPVVREDSGTYVVSTYREVLALLQDRRMSSDPGNSAQPYGAPVPSFISRDPPEHGRLRRLAMRHFGPPHSPGRIDGLRGDFASIVAGLIDRLRGRGQIDIVEDVAYPFPVTVICKLLGVPREDEPRFSQWVDAMVNSLDVDLDTGPGDAQRQGAEAQAQLSQYLAELVEAHRQQPGDDILSALITDDGPEGRMSPAEVVDAGMLLLIAGHETTVNLVSNGVLTLLRHPDVLERLRREPDLIITLVEEVLRYEPPVHLTDRFALGDVPIAGTTIPRGARVALMLGAANRDPSRFADPDRFIPDREDNQHLGFLSGIHYCFGAPMARLEGQIMLSALVRRLENPRLVADPPPYRRSLSLRGPRQLLVEVDGVTAR
jgi:cytochrome P450